jgi:hypothetical protein
MEANNEIKKAYTIVMVLDKVPEGLVFGKNSNIGFTLDKDTGETVVVANVYSESEEEVKKLAGKIKSMFCTNLNLKEMYLNTSTSEPLKVLD